MLLAFPPACLCRLTDVLLFYAQNSRPHLVIMYSRENVFFFYLTDGLLLLPFSFRMNEEHSYPNLQTKYKINEIHCIFKSFFSVPGTVLV